MSFYLDHPNSRLSVVSTAASENQTLRKTPSFSSDLPPEPKHEPHSDVADSMDIDPLPSSNAIGVPYTMDHYVPRPHSRTVSLDLDDIDAPHNVLTQPNGVLIIEKLDTPAIRREKAMRRKAERQRQAAQALDNGLNAVASGSRQAIQRSSSGFADPNTSNDTEDDKNAAQAEEGDGDESELSELSEEESEQPEAAAGGGPKEEQVAETQVIRSKGRTRPRRSTRPKRPKLEQFEDSTIGMSLKSVAVHSH